MSEPVSLLHPTTPPRLRLDFYNTAVLLSRWEADGRQIAHPVSVHDVVSACTHVPINSRLLPKNTLFWKQQGSETTLGIFVPGRRWQVQTEARRYEVPMPPFVFVGRALDYSIFAVKKRPVTGREPLFHVPCPNVHSHGTICPGNTPFPFCSAQTILGALTLFMEDSLFNSHLCQHKCRTYPEDVRQLWAEMDGRKRFLLSELIPLQRSLHALLS